MPRANVVAVATAEPVEAALVEVLANAVHVLALAGDVDSLAIAGEDRRPKIVLVPGPG